MPNWVTNILTVSSNGNEEEFLKFKNEQLKFDKEKDLYDFSFNNIIKMPECLNIEASAKCISKAKAVEKGIEVQYEDDLEFDNVKKLLEVKKETGYFYWYDFRVDKWGTKWDISEISNIDIQQDSALLYFDTAWSTPEPIIKELSILYPSLNFNLKYADEDFGYNVGIYEYENQELMEEYFPEGGSVEANNLAEEVLGYKPENEEEETIE